jgi:hypothetical protein
VIITARCHPALADLLPPPLPARAALPAWLRAMPATVAAESLGGAEVRTLKHCPPFLDALAAGLLIPLMADLTVADGEIAWDWPFPAIDDAPLPRAPLGLHVPEQAAGAPFRLDGQVIVKFLNFWTLEAPEGWQLLYTHPLNREDLPFRTLSGLVAADAWGLGHVHFPALWTDPGFSGVLPRGTPVAQVIPVPREGIELRTLPMTDAEVAGARAIQEALHRDPGHYRRHFRR